LALVNLTGIDYHRTDQNIIAIHKKHSKYISSEQKGENLSGVGVIDKEVFLFIEKYLTGKSSAMEKNINMGM
jgi:hypothetical protein